MKNQPSRPGPVRAGFLRRGAPAAAIFSAAVIFLSAAGAVSAEEKKNPEQERLERRQKVEILGFFMKDPEHAKLPGTPLAIQLYNQAVLQFQKNEYDLARASLRASLEQDGLNSFAYELMGDIEANEQNLAEAKANYEIAFNLRTSEELKNKIEKLQNESKVEKKMARYGEEHFIIRYDKSGEAYEGFEIRELLREAYRKLSRDFAFYFKRKVAVILYDEADFAEITGTPHWVAGTFDGKLRMPINKSGFSDLDVRALTAHEMTHAFVTAMSASRAPAWIQEGLAEYEENKIKPVDLLVFDSGVKTGTLFALEVLMAQEATQNLQDPLLIALFYQQTFHLTRYLVQRYGMYRIKKILAEYGAGKNSDEAIRNVLRISPSRLEKEWKNTFSK